MCIEHLSGKLIIHCIKKQIAVQKKIPIPEKFPKSESLIKPTKPA